LGSRPLLGLGSRVQGPGFGVATFSGSPQVPQLSIQGLGSRVQGPGSRIWGRDLFWVSSSSLLLASISWTSPSFPSFSAWSCLSRLKTYFRVWRLGCRGSGGWGSGFGCVGGFYSPSRLDTCARVQNFVFQSEIAVTGPESFFVRLAHFTLEASSTWVDCRFCASIAWPLSTCSITCTADSASLSAAAITASSPASCAVI
jgi:hypothetical protein